MYEHDRERTVTVPVGPAELRGILAVPEEPVGVVLFAHGSGSGRLSPRNNAVAGMLQKGKLATLLIDLLTEQESQDRRLVFDIALLSRRLDGAAEWLRRNQTTQHLPMGYFGASTGAAAALVSAALLGSPVKAVVSRGGRPDLAADSLPQVEAATLLIVGGRDEVVLRLNEESYAALTCRKELVVVPGATHLFEEPGALEQVADLARDWFIRFLIADR